MYSERQKCVISTGEMFHPAAKNVSCIQNDRRCVISAGEMFHPAAKNVSSRPEPDSFIVRRSGETPVFCDAQPTTGAPCHYGQFHK
jgi:hypothetical protein